MCICLEQNQFYPLHFTGFKVTHFKASVANTCLFILNDITALNRWSTNVTNLYEKRAYTSGYFSSSASLIEHGELGP